MDAQQTRNILEACLLVAGKAMSIAQLESVFESDMDRPDRNEIRDALAQLQSEYEGRGIELVEVATGWRLQTRASMEHWVGRLFQERSPRYSRALLETLVLIAYRQPITRGEIEEVRGVAVSSNIIKTLQEREWVKEIGYKDVPGKPALLGTTRQFLDYFNLKRLDELPTLAEARSLEEIDTALAAAAEAGMVDGEAANDDNSSNSDADTAAAAAEAGRVDGEVTNDDNSSDSDADTAAAAAEAGRVDGEATNDNNSSDSDADTASERHGEGGEGSEASSTPEAPTQATAPPDEVAGGARSDSGSAPESESENESGSEPESESGPESESAVEPQIEADTQGEGEDEPRPENQVVAETEAQTDAETVAEPAAAPVADAMDETAQVESDAATIDSEEPDLASLAGSLAGADRIVESAGLGDLVDRFLHETGTDTVSPDSAGRSAEQEPADDDGRDRGLADDANAEPSDDRPSASSGPLASMAGRLPGAYHEVAQQGLDAVVSRYVSDRSDESRPASETPVEIVSAHDLLVEEWSPSRSVRDEQAHGEDDTDDTDAGTRSDEPMEAEGAESQGAESQLRRVIDEFADEHRREVEAQRDHEARTLKSPKAEPMPDGKPDKAPTMRATAELVSGELSPRAQVESTPLFGVSGMVDAEYERDGDVRERDLTHESSLPGEASGGETMDHGRDEAPMPTNAEEPDEPQTGSTEEPDPDTRDSEP